MGVDEGMQGLYAYLKQNSTAMQCTKVHCNTGGPYLTCRWTHQYTISDAKCKGGLLIPTQEQDEEEEKQEEQNGRRSL